MADLAADSVGVFSMRRRQKRRHEIVTFRKHFPNQFDTNEFNPENESVNQ